MNTATREFKKHNTHLSKPESVNMLGSSVSPLQGQAIAIQTAAPLRMQDRSTGAHSTHAHEEQHHSHDHFGHHHNGDHHDHLHSHGTDQGYNNGHSHSHHHHEHQAHGHDHDHDHDHAHSHYQESHYHAHASSNDHSHHYDQNHLHNHARTVQSPLPSMSSIFSNLSAEQKTIFTVACIQATVGFFIYWTGGSLGNLSMIAFSYLVVFDAIGLINTFLSTVLELEPSFRSRNLKRPFGAVRLQVLFALATAIYLLFFSMQVGKESLEHLLLPSSHDTTENAHTSHSDKTPGLFAFLLSSAAIALSFLSGVNLQNHETFCKVWRRMPITMQGISYSVINRGRQGIINTLRGNIFASTVVGCGCLVVVSSFIFASPALDKLIATFEAAIMFYLAAPTAMALSKLVLQTTPKGLGNGIEGKLRELQQIKGVLSIGRTHFWQNTFGQHVASLEIHVAPDVDEQEVLQSAYQALRGLIKVRGIEQDHSTLDAGELTISIIKA